MRERNRERRRERKIERKGKKQRIKLKKKDKQTKKLTMLFEARILVSFQEWFENNDRCSLVSLFGD